MDTLLLIDYNSLFRRVMELSQVSLSWHGMPTNGIYGFINQFCDNVLAVDPKHVIVCSDSRPYDRNKIFPDYKKNHKQSDIPYEVGKFNRDKVDEFLNLINVCYWKEPGLEADDLIAICCRQYDDRYDRIVIASGDSDLYQLLRYNNIFLRKKVKKKHILYSRQDFKKEFNGLTIGQFIRYLSIKGTHNAVPGIKGLGEVKAMKIARDDDLYDELLRKYKDEIYLYRRLIKLPYRDDTQKFPKFTKAIYPERKIILLLSTVGINITKHIHDGLTKLGGH